jgi:hypothetical protein
MQNTKLIEKETSPIRFEINQSSNENLNFSDHHKFLNTKKEWVENFYPNKIEYNKINRPWKNLTQHKFKEILRNFESKNTHTGLIYYYHYCWAKELGAVLRPDILWYTIISELTRHILIKPENFRHLFTNSDEKQSILVRTPTTELVNVNTLTNRLAECMPNKKLFKTICDTKFESEDKGANYAIRTVFANMCIPFYQYFSTLCGIPSVDLESRLDDWIVLYDAIESLCTLFRSSYLERCKNLVANIIYFGFNKYEYALFDKMNYGDPVEFFTDIFHYGENDICMSGHAKYKVRGWLREFYDLDVYDEDLERT